MVLNITVAQTIVDGLGLQFDSHSFIRKLLQKHPEIYGEKLVSRQDVNLANGEISSFLSRNAKALNIEIVCHDFVSQNILGNDSPNALWKKI